MAARYLGRDVVPEYKARSNILLEIRSLQYSVMKPQNREDSAESALSPAP